LVEKANKEKPSHIVIPHPDTNPVERQKQIDKMHALSEAADVSCILSFFSSLDHGR
jgi:ubiquitin-conjugating enzyme E2 R